MIKRFFIVFVLIGGVLNLLPACVAKMDVIPEGQEQQGGVSYPSNPADETPLPKEERETIKATGKVDLP